MRGKTVVVIIFALAGLGALGIALAVRYGGQPLAVISDVPGFSLTDQDGHPFGLQQLKESATVVDFFFSRCMGPCPMMASEMAKLQSTFDGETHVRFVSISVDPANDTPPVLTEYASSVGAKPGRWIFLTGVADSIVKLSEDGFKLAASSWPVEHSIKFTLVDKFGRIRGYYDSSDPKAMKDLELDIGRLLRSRQRG